MNGAAWANCVDSTIRPLNHDAKRKFRIGEKHHNAWNSEILLVILILHVFISIEQYYYFENSAEVD